VTDATMMAGTFKPGTSIPEVALCQDPKALGAPLKETVCRIGNPICQDGDQRQRRT
jgi:hypothetical protein